MTTFYTIIETFGGVFSVLEQLISKTIEANRNNKWFLRGVIIFLLISIFLSIKLFSGSTVDSKLVNLVISNLRSESELVTAKMDGKATVALHVDKKVWVVPLGDTNLVYEGVGTIRASIDLSKIEIVKANLKDKEIYLKLPAPHVMEVSLDVDHSNTMANYRHWFGDKAGPELYEKAQRKAMAEIRKQACAQDILDLASENAKTLIEKSFRDSKLVDSIQIDIQPTSSNICLVS